VPTASVIFSYHYRYNIILTGRYYTHRVVVRRTETTHRLTGKTDARISSRKKNRTSRSPSIVMENNRSQTIANPRDVIPDERKRYMLLLHGKQRRKRNPYTSRGIEKKNLKNATRDTISVRKSFPSFSRCNYNGKLYFFSTTTTQVQSL